MTTAAWALLASVVALVASGVAVATSVVLLRRTKPRVSVTWEGSFPMYRDGRVGDRHVAVTATNDGYRAATIIAWGFTVDDTDETLVDIEPDPWLPSVPYRLGPQDAVTWRIPVASIAASLCRANRPHATLHAFATLATGQRIADSVPITSATFAAAGEPQQIIDLRSSTGGDVSLGATQPEPSP